MIKKIIFIMILATSLMSQTDRWRVIWDPNPPADSVLFYEVYIGVDSASMSLVDTVYHPNTEYRDSLGINGLGLQPGNIYYYRIRATNRHDFSPLSDAAYASIPEISFDSLSFRSNTDTTFNLNQSQFVNDPDYGITQLEWMVIDSTPGDLIIHSMIDQSNINFSIAPGMAEEDQIQFTVFDIDSFYDSKSIRVISLFDSLEKPTGLDIVK